MKHIAFIPTLLLALLLAGCTHEDIPHRETPPLIDGANTHVSTRIAIALSGSETLTVNTIRVIIFTENGDYITHGLYHVVNDNRIIARDGNYIIIDRTTLGSDYSRFSIPTVSGISHVYVILNEESGRLTNALNGVNTMTALQGLLSLPIAYTELIAASGEEPAFTMYIRGTFEVEEARPFDNPQVLDFSALDPDLNVDPDSNEGITAVRLIRPMIRVTITDFTNKLMDGQTEEFDRTLEEFKQTSLIYILEMGFRNVPITYFLNSELNPSGDTPWALHQNPLLIDRRTIQDTDEEFFVRDWNASFTLHLDGRVREVARAGTGGQVFLDGCHSTEIISLNRNDIIRSTGFNDTGRYSRLTTGGTAAQSGTGFASANSFNLFYTPGTITRLSNNQTSLDILVNAQRQANNGNRTALDNLIRDARGRTDNRSVWQYIGQINTGVQNQISNLLGGMVLNPGGDFTTSGWDFVPGVMADVEFEPGIWSLIYKPSFYLPENMSSDATELHLKAAQLTGEAIARGGFDRPSPEVVKDHWIFSIVDDSEYPTGTQFRNVPSNVNLAILNDRQDLIKAGYGRWVFHNPVGGAGVTNWDEDQMAAHWRFEVIRVVGAGTPNARIIGLDEPGGDLFLLHYIETGIFQWRYLYAEGSTTLTHGEIRPSSFTEHSPTATFAIPISSGTPAHTFRNHEYRFSVHATHPWPWWEEVPDGRGTRSTNNNVPFVLQRVD